MYGFLFSVIVQLVSTDHMYTTISSSVLNGTAVQPGEEVSITCVTCNSSILIWISEDYIIQNGLQEFTSESRDQIGVRITQSSENVIAVLDSVNITSDGNTIMMSTVRIRVSLLYPKYSVTCRNGGYYIDKSFTFYVDDKQYIEGRLSVALPNKIT